MLSALFNTEKITHDTIQSTLESVAEELGCSHKEFFLMIKPTNEEFDMKFYIFKQEEKIPQFIREISLKEILG
jgi:hypothetical protein